MLLISPRLEFNTRREVRQALAAGVLKAAIIPTGSTEQHNEHLAMSHDTESVHFLAVRTAQQLLPQAIVTPPISVGISPHWMAHPGTLTLAPETFAQVLQEICASLKRHGIEKMLVLNGHAGNRACLQEKVPEIAARLAIRMDYCSYWELYPSELIKRCLESGDCPGHAAEFETSLALALFPENVHWREEAYPEAELPPLEAQELEQDRRFFRAARLATKEKGEALTEWVVAALVERLLKLLSA